MSQAKGSDFHSSSLNAQSIVNEVLAKKPKIRVKWVRLKLQNEETVHSCFPSKRQKDLQRRLNSSETHLNPLESSLRLSRCESFRHGQKEMLLDVLGFKWVSFRLRPPWPADRNDPDLGIVFLISLETLED